MKYPTVVWTNFKLTCWAKIIGTEVRLWSNMIINDLASPVSWYRSKCSENFSRAHAPTACLFFIDESRRIVKPHLLQHRIRYKFRCFFCSSRFSWWSFFCVEIALQHVRLKFVQYEYYLRGSSQEDNVTHGRTMEGLQSMGLSNLLPKRSSIQIANLAKVNSSQERKTVSLRWSSRLYVHRTRATVKYRVVQALVGLTKQ